MRGSDEVAVAFLMLILLAICEVGFRLGKHQKQRLGANAEAQLAAVQGPILSLLSLLLAFTVSMAERRYQARMGLAVDEANAIGSTYLRSAFAPASARRELEPLLKQYIVTRNSFYAQPTAAGESTTAAEQEHLWAVAADVGQNAPASITAGLLIQSMNHVIDLQESMTAAYANVVPNSIIALLAFASMAAVGTVGYRGGLFGSRHFVVCFFLALLVTSTMYVILDLDRPNSGLIRVRNESLDRLATRLHP